MAKKKLSWKDDEYVKMTTESGKISIRVPKYVLRSFRINKLKYDFLSYDDKVKIYLSSLFLNKAKGAVAEIHASCGLEQRDYVLIRNMCIANGFIDDSKEITEKGYQYLMFLQEKELSKHQLRTNIIIAAIAITSVVISIIGILLK